MAKVNREETLKAPIAPVRMRLRQLSDIGAVRDPDEPHGAMVPYDEISRPPGLKSENAEHSD